MVFHFSDPSLTKLYLVILGFVLVDETVLERNNLIYTIPILKRLFKISFDLFINPSDKSPWQSVLHFTQGRDTSRLPGIFVGSHNKFYIAMSRWIPGTHFFSKTVLTQEHKR